MKKIFFLVMISVVLIGAGVSVLRHQRINEVVTEAETVGVDTAQETISPSPEPSSQETASLAKSFPNRLQVTSVGIDLTVAKGYYNQDTQKWTLSRNKAHFATMTDMPNTETGNTYIYGHNRKEVFTPLTKIKPGAEAIVYTESGQKFTYRLARSITTKPDDSSMLFYKGSPILTLQTCTGALYQNRTLYVFELTGVINA
jgi:LPXTG-site transpeptidase (sortase) family protein